MATLLNEWTFLPHALMRSDFLSASGALSHAESSVADDWLRRRAARARHLRKRPKGQTEPVRRSSTGARRTQAIGGNHADDSEDRAVSVVR
jgi:hypothetical protein